MTKKEEKIKMDANSLLLKSEGFVLATVDKNGIPKMCVSFGEISHLERTGLFVWLRHHINVEIQSYFRQAKKIKDYEEDEV